MAGKRWDEAALPKGALGYSNPYGSDPDDLYARFPDGTFQLLEKGHGKRMAAEAKATNERLYGIGGNVDVLTINTKSTIAATPASVTSSPTATASTQVKSATKDIIIFDDGAIPIDLMADLVFEDIGGQELINIARRDTVNGQKISYQPIKNLSSIEQQYNPNNIVSLQATADKYFANFPIKLDDKIPQTGEGPGGDYVYIDTTTGNLIVEAVNLESDEQIEIQIARSGTIYETDFNEGAS